MNSKHFTSQLKIQEETERLGKKAMDSGLISNFAILYFPDSWEFCIPVNEKYTIFTPEEAYFYFKKLVEQLH